MARVAPGQRTGYFLFELCVSQSSARDGPSSTNGPGALLAGKIVKRRDGVSGPLFDRAQCADAGQRRAGFAGELMLVNPHLTEPRGMNVSREI